MKSRLIEKDLDAGKDWGQEEKEATEDEMVGWYHHRRWTWVWASCGRWWRTRKPGRCSPWGHKELDKTETLNNNNNEKKFPHCGREGYLQRSWHCLWVENLIFTLKDTKAESKSIVLERLSVRMRETERDRERERERERKLCKTKRIHLKYSSKNWSVCASEENTWCWGKIYPDELERKVLGSQTRPGREPTLISWKTSYLQGWGAVLLVEYLEKFH